MESVIEKIYLNFLFNDELKPRAEYNKCRDKFYDEYDKLFEKLPEDLKPLFDNVMDLRNEMEAEGSLDNFKYGFEVGLKIGVEAL